MDYKKEINDSDWNEGTFKAIRLHEIQTAINVAKLDLLGKPFGNEFGYKSWYKLTKLLYGEGQSKYTDKEKEECAKITRLIDFNLKYYPPHKLVSSHGMGEKKQKDLVNYKYLEELSKLVEMYEMLVKDLNDKHGWTTKNKGTGGLF